MVEVLTTCTLRFSLACVLLLFAAIPAPFESATADTTVVRVLFRDGPVKAAPVEIIDVRSGITVATAETDRRGRAVFEGLQKASLYEAQTPNGEFVSGSFEAGAFVKLIVPDDAGPLFGVSLSVAADVGEVSGNTFLGCCDGVREDSEQFGSGGNGVVVAPTIHGRIVGPELGPFRIRFFVEGGVAPAN